MSTRLMRTLVRGLLVAMLLAVLAPAVSRALTRMRVAGDWVEICTLQGMRWVQLASEKVEKPSDDGGELLHALNDCGHCSLTAERFAPLHPAGPVGPLAAGTHGLPTHRADLGYTLDAPSPGARDPPRLS